ncbi:hypothetical protein CRP13_gp43 [Roseobacter phage CRP-13]|nr:hypothetical protein CRP13_gp43 [Roseobacter phage CRP-13]
MSKARDLADFISTGSILSDGTIESTEISGVTATANEINTLDGITATTEELNNVAGVNSDVQTQLDGKQAIVAGVSGTEIGYLDGVTSNLQTQLDNISVTSGSLTKSFTSGETASITLAQAISPAPVVSVTKEVSQAGISSKGAWDVNATASNYELHNTAYATTLTPSNVTDFSTISYNNAVHYTNDSTTTGVYLSSDGYHLFYIGGVTDTIRRHDLSTAFDISTTGSQVSSFSIGSQDTEPGQVWFKPDGTKMYMAGYENNSVYQYSLSTAWDLTTASYDSVSFSVASQVTLVVGMAFNDDGTKMYVCCTTNNAAYQYSLSTAWDLSTASYDSKSVSLNSTPNGIAFNDDGSIFFHITAGTDTLYWASLTTAYDISTLDNSTYQSFSMNSQDSNARDIFIVESQLKAYMAGNTNDGIFEYTYSSTDVLTLGTGSFASTDVGKRIQGNGGDVTLTSTAGAYDTTGGSAFTDSSTIASGSWTMRGLKSAGDADGIGFAGFANFYDIANASGIQTYSGTSSYMDYPSGLTLKPDGTSFYYADRDSTRRTVYEFNMSTPYDLSSAVVWNTASSVASYTNTPTDVKFSSDGTRMYVIDEYNNNILQFTLSTPWNIGTASYDRDDAAGSAPTGLFFKPDGTKFYISNSGDQISEYHMTTPWSIATAPSTPSIQYNTFLTGDSNIAFSSDGTKLFKSLYNTKVVHQFNLTTAWDISTASNSGITFDTSNDITTLAGIFFDPDGSYLYALDYTHQNINRYSVGSFSLPTSQYHIGVTNSGGQIDTALWTDINSMTADQAAGDGTVHYAVSTDDRTTWSVAKASDGVRPIVRDNSGTWQYNSDAGSLTGAYDLSTAVLNQSKDISSDTPDPYGIIFKPDGTKMFVLDDGFAAADDVLEYGLSTAWDVSTATFTQAYRLLSSEAAVQGMDFKSDGTQVYIVGSITDAVYAYDLSTAWDISTASYNSVNFSTASQTTTPFAVKFKSDGAKMYVIGSAEDTIYEYDLSTSWDVSTASYNNVSYYFNPQVAAAKNLTFNSTGTKLYLAGSGDVYEYNLSTAWDLSSISYSNVNFSVSESDGITFKPDGTKMFMCGSSNDLVVEYDIGSIGYGTATTWTNATTNDEFYALQQALGAQAFNRMDKTQLDAVADGSHFTLGDTLDLAIALRLDTASASTPKSDGVSINYDAQALNQGAVLGTDYDYDFPDSTTVRVTSNAAQNLKIRVV